MQSIIVAYKIINEQISVFVVISNNLYHSDYIKLT